MVDDLKETVFYWPDTRGQLHMWIYSDCDYLFNIPQDQARPNLSEEKGMCPWSPNSSKGAIDIS